MISKINMFDSWITGVMRIVDRHQASPKRFAQASRRVRLRLITLVVLLWSGALVIGANTYYVATNGPGGGATTWATATNNIQDAISLCAVGDLVLVSNGVYETGGVKNWPGGLGGTDLTNRVAITNAITVRSANNDPTNTIIKGSSPKGPAAVRCVFMTNNSWLIGFTLTNGATLSGGTSPTESNDYSGGGAWCSGAISNCIITGNSAQDMGAGVRGGTLFNCQLIGNTIGGNYSLSYGGGAAGSILSNCTIIGNSARGAGGADRCTMYNCSIIKNTPGGTCYGSMFNCTYISNSTTVYGGGAQHPAKLDRCTFIGNSAVQNGGGVGGAGCSVINCLFIGNSSGNSGGGAFFYSTGT
ncbi:MAG: hypothetical protein KKA28_20140, partial [Planctomycetes bacterium]|nr:hypothetical protein [Planctomycetota bacterium]